MSGDRPDDARRDGDRDTVDPDLTRGEIRSRAASGVALLLGRGVAFRVLGLLGNLVLARLLVPKDFGLVAIGLTIVSVTQLLAGASIVPQFISRPEPPSHSELRAIVGLQLAIASPIGILTALIAGLFGGDALVTAVMLLALPVGAIRSSATLLFSRRMEFSQTVRIEIAEVVSYLVFSITAAAYGLGVWSLALATLFRSAAGVIVAVRLSPAGLVLPSWDPAMMRSIIRGGAGFQLTSAVHLGHDAALTAGIGIVGGLTTVGLWSFAGRFLQIPNLLFEALFSVGFPAFSRLQDANEDPAVVRDLLERLVSVVAIGVTGVMCPLVAASAAAVPLLFGDNWAGVSQILPGAAFALVFSGPVAIVVFGILYARGDAKTLLRVSLLHAVVRIPLTLSLLPVVGPAAIGIGWVAGVLAELPFTLASVRRLTGALLMRHILPASTWGTLATGAGWLLAEHLGRTVVSALAAASVGGLGYLIFMVMFARPDVERATAMLRNAWRAGRGAEPVLVA
jgi:O-antigen/teichoic acid export membrane protein